MADAPPTATPTATLAPPRGLTIETGPPFMLAWLGAWYAGLSYMEFELSDAIGKSNGNEPRFRCYNQNGANKHAVPVVVQCGRSHPLTLKKHPPFPLIDRLPIHEVRGARCGGAPQSKFSNADHDLVQRDEVVGSENVTGNQVIIDRLIVDILL